MSTNATLECFMHVVPASFSMSQALRQLHNRPAVACITGAHKQHWLSVCTARQPSVHWQLHAPFRACAKLCIDGISVPSRIPNASRSSAASSNLQHTSCSWHSRQLDICTRKKGANKGKHVNKSDLPSKTCVVCGLPFTW